MMKEKLSKDLFILLGGLWGGGAEKIAVDVANNLPSSISTLLVTIYDSGDKYSVSVPHISLSGKNMSLVSRIVKLPLNYIRYIILLKKYSPKVSLSILPEDNVLNIITSKIMGVKPIISFHGMPSNKNAHIITRFFLRLSLLLSKIFSINIVAVSGGVKKELVELYGVPEQNIHIIYNPIDVLNISCRAEELVDDFAFSPERNTIITVGRLHAVKGQWHLIRAFAEFRKNNPSQLLICGEGEEMNYLLDLVKNLEIEDSVTFLGWKDNPYKYMSKSSVFVQSSLSEALPNVLVEAMACGCPVVAASCSDGISEILGSDGSCGIVTKKMSGVRHLPTEPLDEGEVSLLEGMEEILLNSERRNVMAIRCIERAKMFDVDVGIQKYYELIVNQIE